MKPFQKLQSLFFLCLLAVGIAAPASAHEAKVLKVTGTAQVQLPGSASPQPLTVDMMVPQGALITTEAGGQVFLETFPGAVATIEANTSVLVEKLAISKQGETVTSQEALLDLKKGNVISTLDPTKKAINRYGVRTPKGVAAARGTVYGVSVNISGTTVATLTGAVTINLGNGVTVNIPVGMAVTGDSNTLATIAAAIAASGQAGLTVEQLLRETVQAVAANVAANTSAAGSSETATAVLAAVVSAASSAAPAQAAQFVEAAVAAAASSSSATGGSDAAVAAITEAAVRANPNAATDISAAASKAVVETKVTEAVAAARASGGDVEAAAQAGAQAAAATLQTVAQTVVNTAASVGASVSADAIAAAVTTGAQTGATTASQETGTVVTAPPVAAPAPPATDTPPPSAPIVTPPTQVDLPPVSPSGSNL